MLQPVPDRGAGAGREKLAKISGRDAVFFCNRAARPRGRDQARAGTARQGIADPAIVVMDKAFTAGPLQRSGHGNKKVQTGFEPLVSGFVRVS